MGAASGCWFVSQQCHVDSVSLIDSYVYFSVENLGQIAFQNLGQITLRALRLRQFAAFEVERGRGERECTRTKAALALLCR